MRSCTLRTAVGLSFRRAAVAESPARRRLGPVRGHSLTLRVLPTAEWRRQTIATPTTVIRTSHLEAPFWLPREDAAADYPCKHGGKKQPKLCPLHRGVLRRAQHHPRSHYKAACPSSLAQQLRQLGDIHRDPPRLIFAQQLSGRSLALFVGLFNRG